MKKTKLKKLNPVLFSTEQNEQNFEIAFKNAPIGMCLTDSKGSFLKVNKAYCKMLGYSEKELLEKTLKELTLPEDLQQNLHQRRKMLKNKAKYFQIEKRYLHKSGRIVWGLLSASLVKNDKGNPQFFIGQVEDITERKKIEHERENLLVAQKNIADTLQETSSPAIGVILNERFINNSTFLEAEDLLVLYTDGVIDAKCIFKGKKKSFFGEKRLLSTIKKSHAAAKTISEEIFQSIMYCPGCVLPDDIVILAVSLAKKRSLTKNKPLQLAKA